MATPAVQWQRLAALPRDASSVGSAAALPLAAGASALLISAGDTVVAGGTSDETTILLPDSASEAATAPVGQWLPVGNVPSTGPAFSDPFDGTSLDARWYAGARVRVSGHGAMLAPARDAVGVLLQGGNTGDGVLTVQTTLPAHPASGTAAGLVMYLDSGDWVTLLADGSGRVSFCAAAWQNASPCATQMPKRGATHMLWLKIQRQGTTFVGLTSLDNATWTLVGQWTPLWGDDTAGVQASSQDTPAVVASPGAGAAHVATVAPLAFPSCGILVRGTAPDAAWPVFSQFTVASLPMS
jgi:hypothetical protein